MLYPGGVIPNTMVVSFDDDGGSSSFWMMSLNVNELEMCNTNSRNGSTKKFHIRRRRDPISRVRYLTVAFAKEIKLRMDYELHAAYRNIYSNIARKAEHQLLRGRTAYCCLRRTLLKNLKYLMTIALLCVFSYWNKMSQHMGLDIFRI